jgi:CRP-like cAMP-binding protein
MSTPSLSRKPSEASASALSAGLFEQEYDGGGATYEKEIESDISRDQAITYLKDVKSLNRVFKPFTDYDIEELAGLMSVLKFGPGDPIVEKGEDASFFAIILSGVFNAKVTETLTVPLGKGLVLGEMSYFEGGQRNASVSCANDGIVAVFTFAAMNQLMAEGGAELAAKLIKMLATSSIRKLHKSSDKEETEGAPTKVAKKETLFRNRASRASGARASVAANRLNHDDIARKQEKLEQTAHKNKNAELAAQKQIRNLRKSLTQAEDIIKEEKRRKKEFQKVRSVTVAMWRLIRSSTPCD